MNLVLKPLKTDIQQLVESAQAGDRAAFAELIVRYEKVVITKAWSVLNDFHFAQDTAQEAFVTAYKQLASLREPIAFGPWLLEIVRRLALKAQSRRENFRSLDSDVENSGDDWAPAWQHQHAMVIEAIKKLPNHEQDVVVLFYLEDLSTKEVAACVNRPIGTVTKQLSRGVMRLRSLLVETTHEHK